MRLIGFSTGALAYSNFQEGLRMLKDERIRAAELSALRISEWKALFLALNQLDLNQFDYVSVHLPSSMTAQEERAVATDILESRPRWTWPLILHPDAISDWSLWRELGQLVCVENMDVRKEIGRTDRELDLIFGKLPESRLCFDIGHAWQVDPSMGAAYWILKRFQDKLVQVHVSEVNSHSKHDTLSYTTIESYRQVANLIPPNIPLILETPVSQAAMLTEVHKARFALAHSSTSVLVA
jgi:hypothetical protein